MPLRAFCPPLTEFTGEQKIRGQGFPCPLASLSLEHSPPFRLNRLSRPGHLAVPVAFQHLASDGFLDPLHRGVEVLRVNLTGEERANDVDLAPLIELLHEGAL